MMPGKRIAIRLDGGSGYEIGMGHVVRSTAVAGRLKRHDVRVVFLTRDYPEAVGRLRATGNPVRVLPAEMTELDECALVVRMLEEEPVDALIMDRLHTTEQYMSRVRRKVPRLISFDDLGAGAACADLVVNGILHGEPEGRDAAPHVLSGPEYVCLREQFAEAHDRDRPIREAANSLLVAFGGSDPPGLTLQVIAALDQMEDAALRITVVGGPAFVQRAALEALAARARHAVMIRYDVEDMAALMCGCDLAITAAGGMIYELAATGTPAVVLCQYGHQLPTARRFGEQGVVVNLGLGADVRPETLGEAVGRLRRGLRERHEMSQRGKAMVDGRGMDRVMAAVMALMDGTA